MFRDRQSTRLRQCIGIEFTDLIAKANVWNGSEEILPLPTALSTDTDGHKWYSYHMHRVNKCNGATKRGQTDSGMVRSQVMLAGVWSENGTK